MKVIEERNLSVIGDSFGNGNLITLDDKNQAPFNIKRVYYIFNNINNKSRGFHAHKTLHQVAICISGSCRIVCDDGINREDRVISSPNVYIDLPPLLWHELHDFSNDCVLLVLADNYYDEQDYIRNYQDFLRYINK